MNCDKCKKIFTSEKRLNQHITAGCAICEKCKKVYSNMTYLRKHIEKCTSLGDSENHIEELNINLFKESIEMYNEKLCFKKIKGLVIFFKKVSNDRYICKDIKRCKFYRFDGNSWIEDVKYEFLHEFMNFIHRILLGYLHTYVCSTLTQEFIEDEHEAGILEPMVDFCRYKFSSDRGLSMFNDFKKELAKSTYQKTFPTFSKF